MNCNSFCDELNKFCDELVRPVQPKAASAMAPSWGYQRREPLKVKMLKNIKRYFEDVESLKWTSEGHINSKCSNNQGASFKFYRIDLQALFDIVLDEFSILLFFTKFLLWGPTLWFIIVFLNPIASNSVLFEPNSVQLAYFFEPNSVQ